MEDKICEVYIHYDEQIIAAPTTLKVQFRPVLNLDEIGPRPTCVNFTTQLLCSGLLYEYIFLSMPVNCVYSET